MHPAAAAIHAWRENPALFCREVLHAQPDEWQLDVLAAAGKNQRIALKASKGPGKSTLLAWIGWWFLMTRAHPKVVATSISGDNLADGLWVELAKWQANSPLLLKTFTWTATRIQSNHHPKTWWASARTWPKTANASEQAKTLAGLHADNVLFLIDEVGGIPDAVVATAEAGLANADEKENREAMLVIAGNPTHTSGPLWRACTQERKLWWVKEISGDPDDPKRAPRVSKEWARQQIAKYGRDNPWVLINVFGQFPPSQSNTLIGVEDATKATKRTLKRGEFLQEPKVLGIDVARQGDDRSVLFPRQGRAAMAPKVFRNLDTQDLAHQTALFIDRWQPDAVFIDQATFGMGVVDRLTHLGYPVQGIDFGGKAINSGKFANKRAEMWWGLMEWLRSGGCTPLNDELIGEMSTPTYHFDDHGRLLLEKKAEVKKRTGTSPDLADALALTFAAPVAHAGMRRLLDKHGRGTAGADYDPFDDEPRGGRRRSPSHDYDPMEAE
jgi:phage terminase large subunit